MEHGFGEAVESEVLSQFCSYSQAQGSPKKADPQYDLAKRKSQGRQSQIYDMAATGQSLHYELGANVGAGGAAGRRESEAIYDTAHKREVGAQKCAKSREAMTATVKGTPSGFCC